MQARAAAKSHVFRHWCWHELTDVSREKALRQHASGKPSAAGGKRPPLSTAICVPDATGWGHLVKRTLRVLTGHSTKIIRTGALRVLTGHST